LIGQRGDALIVLIDGVYPARRLGSLVELREFGSTICSTFRRSLRPRPLKASAAMAA
jgi:hypothetical protein